MTQTTFTEFRKHAKTYFDSVERGTTVQVLRYGKVIAEITPPHESTDNRAWKRPGLKLLVPGVSLTKSVLAERRESRA